MTTCSRNNIQMKSNVDRIRLKRILQSAAFKLGIQIVVPTRESLTVLSKNLAHRVAGPELCPVLVSIS